MYNTVSAGIADALRTTASPGCWSAPSTPGMLCVTTVFTINTITMATTALTSKTLLRRHIVELFRCKFCEVSRAPRLWAVSHGGVCVCVYMCVRACVLHCVRLPRRELMGACVVEHSER